MQYELSKSKCAADVILPVLATSAVALRFIARKKQKVPLQGDDWFILAALLLAVGVCIAGVYAAAIDIYGVPAQLLTPSEWEIHQKFLFSDVLVCHTCYGFIKVSILLFYKRIFVTPKFKMAANIMLGFVAAWFIAATFGHIFARTPVHLFWTASPQKWNSEPGIDYGAYLSSMAAIDIVLDLVTLCLPIPVIRNLHVRTIRKVQLVFIFALGLFCVVASGVRFYWTWELYLQLHGKIPPSTVAPTDSWNDIWAHIEACASIVCACLPTLAPLLSKTLTFKSFFASISSLVNHCNVQLRSFGKYISRRSTRNSSAHPTAEYPDTTPFGASSPSSDRSGKFSRRGWYELGHENGKDRAMIREQTVVGVDLEAAKSSDYRPRQSVSTESLKV